MGVVPARPGSVEALWRVLEDPAEFRNHASPTGHARQA
ncbi:hypothetical protein L841_1607 [Mycobacterium sp. MAC_080597_8934]|nr:hypothetical protein L839_4452 [Mycobacterium avium MAV_120809_2495]ETZ55389.1 hypothetical protein L840_4111 [Mycobacterium sp. MAC_011194_8550]ETZ69037.1 hypothetical protein L841_1607 [Mycobacterium sp. MAC_080597_8934]